MQIVHTHGPTCELTYPAAHMQTSHTPLTFRIVTLT
jgi:hypothetical protein